LRLACKNLPRHDARVNKLCILAGTTILGYAFWAVGELLGLEFFGCFLLSGVGSIAGVWLGWRVAQHFK
jgi:hypothetical protein